MPEFTPEELAELAEHICGRCQALRDIIRANPTGPSARGCRDSLESLVGLEAKLLPWWKDTPAR